MNLKILIFLLLFAINFCIFGSNTDISLKFIKSYEIKISAANYWLVKLDSKNVIIYDFEVKKTYLIKNINSKDEKIIDLNFNLDGELFNLNDNIIFVENNGENIFIPYTYDIRDNKFVKGYSIKNELYYEDNKIFYNKKKIVQVFPLSTETNDILSLESACGIKNFKDKLFYINKNALEEINDLWVYDFVKGTKKVISETTAGYLILEDNLLFICGSNNPNKIFYLTDFDGNIKASYEKGNFNNIVFYSGEKLDDKYLILVGFDKNPIARLMLYEYRIKKGESNEKNIEKLIDHVTFRSRVNNLRVRWQPDLTSKVLKVLSKGEYVRILQIGKEITVDNIKGKWVEVYTQDGIKGWCFNGYLEEVK